MTDSKKILIVSDACYPELSPRAFRTTELARELGREGHSVTLLLPHREHFRLHPLDAPGVEVIYADGPEEHEAGSATAQRNRRLRRFMPKFVQRWILYFYCHELYARYNPGLYSRLCRIDSKQDMVLSIAYPVAVHRAMTRAMKVNPLLRKAVCVAEFSDPPFRGDVASNVIPLYYLNLRRWARTFDYFTIPVEKALPCYTPYIERNRILIIPQGFDLQAVQRLPYTPHTVPTFAYAGRFYERIRDPQFFFDYLSSHKGAFHMDLFINHLEPRFATMIAEAARMSNGSVELHDALPREELIAQLSTADFLINFDNATAHATPSKLIDYAMTGRPVFSFNAITFDRTAFEHALAGDYSQQTALPDLSQYDIRTIAARFLALLPTGNK